MKKLFVLFALSFAACASTDVDDSLQGTERAYDDDAVDIDHVEQAALETDVPHNIWVRPSPVAGWEGEGHRQAVFANPSGSARYYTLSELAFTRTGGFTWCNYGSPTDWTGMWCDGVWYQCPNSAQLTEATFYVWNDGIANHGNWNWNLPSTKPMYQNWNMVSNLSSATRKKPTVVGVPGQPGKVTFTCLFSVSGFLLVHT